MASGRRSMPEVVAFSKVNGVTSAIVHGLLASVSRVKKGRNSEYFEGILSDGECKLRFVGFHRLQHKKLSSFWKERKPVFLRNCKIKKSRNSERMDVVLKSTTEIGESSRTYDDSAIDVDDDGDSFILSQIEEWDNFDKVDIRCKVVKVRDAVKVNGGKFKQNISVGDRTGVGHVILWEEHIGSLQAGGSYQLAGFLVREFAGKKHLSMARDGSSMTSIEDLGDMKMPDEDDDDDDCTMTDVRIVAVPQLDRYKSCMICKARVEPSVASLGECTKCFTTQRIDLCSERLSARLLIKAGSKSIFVNAFGKFVEDLCALPVGGVVTTNGLLCAPMISQLRFNSSKIITDVKR